VATRIQVTIDCADPQAQAKFWATALHYEPDGPPEGYASWQAWLVDMEVPESEWDDGAWLADPAGEGPRIFFQKVPEEKVAKNRLHLDLDVGVRGQPMPVRQQRVDAEADRLVAAGATVAFRDQTGKHYHVTMQDLEGNEFCLH
jgi:hypothetical protein